MDNFGVLNSSESLDGARLGDGHPVLQTPSYLAPCCVKTVRMHAKHNQMMVCNECKQIIKCYTDEKPLRAYLKFCESRHRKVGTSVVGDYYVVTFASYEPFVR